MNTITLSTLLLIVFIVIFIWMGLWFRKMVVSSEDFMLAGRKAPFWLLASAYLGGFIGGASVSGYAGYGFQSGILNLWTALFVAGGVALFVIIFARRANYFGRKTGAVTLSDFICARYGESLRLPTAILAFFRPSFITGMQLLAVAIVLNVALGIPLKYGVIASAIIVLLYMITGGQYSALGTQWLQSILQSIGIVLFAFAAFKLIGGVNPAVESFYNVLPAKFTNIWAVDPKIFTVWLISFCLFYLVDPWLYMWAYVGETPRVSSNAQLAVMGASYYNVLPFIAGMAFTVAVTTGSLVIPKTITPDGLYAWFAMNKVGAFLGSFLIVGLVMTILSCASSFAMNGALILTRDIYEKYLNKSATDKQLLAASRISVIVVLAIAIMSALWLPILVPLWVLAQALAISGLLAPTISAWFWKRATTSGALASSVAGLLAALGWAMIAWIKNGNPGSFMYGLHAAHFGLIVSIPMMIIVSLLTRPEYEKAPATNWWQLGKEMETSPLVKEKQTGKGFFAWLGADNFFVKLLWVFTFASLILHYLLSFVFHIKAFGYLLIWISFIMGVGLIFLLLVMGLKDIFHIAAAQREKKAKKKELSIMS